MNPTITSRRPSFIGRHPLLTLGGLVLAGMSLRAFLKRRRHGPLIEPVIDDDALVDEDLDFGGAVHEEPVELPPGIHGMTGLEDDQAELEQKRRRTAGIPRSADDRRDVGEHDRRRIVLPTERRGTWERDDQVAGTPQSPFARRSLDREDEGQDPQKGETRPEGT